MPAERTYGMDQDYTDWSPIVSRPPLTWPEGARVALAVIVNLEHWDWQMLPNAPLPLGGMREPTPGGGGGPPGLWTGGARFPDIGGFGNREYGNRVGVFRVFEVLDRYGIRPTVAMDKTIAEHYPTLVREAQQRQAEFIGHGTSARHIIHAGMSDEEERAYIHASVEAVAKATGERPVGWLSPAFQESLNTPNLVAAAGMRYICDWGNDEQPYRMHVKEGELYSVSPSLYLDDEYIHIYGRRTVNEVNLLWRDWFDGLYADGAHSGRMMILNLHPWAIGQPWRIRHLDEVLAHITCHAGVWKATGHEIVDWYRASSG
jgi:peptidoglycan/xylan/chitin deacetylase (PgdA/CDA1 family)